MPTPNHVEYFRPTTPCEIDANGFPIPQIIGWHSSRTGNGGFYWEITHPALDDSISGDTSAECLNNWIREFEDTHGHFLTYRNTHRKPQRQFAF